MNPNPEHKPPDPLVDSIIASRYKILARIARGGMATVYLAQDQALQRQVAIKVLEPPKVTDDPAKLLERFRREAESLAALNHRHIVTVFDYGPTEYGGYFIVMEYVAGQSLTQALKSGMPPERGIRLMAQIARALRYAHRKGIVHRDLKPGNILVGREEDEDVAKLVDFGLVKTDEESLTQFGLILGSVHCMAPEQVRGKDMDGRTDIYAFGCCLFLIITGQYPFPSKVSTEVLAAQIHATVPTFAEVGAANRVSPRIEQVVMKCLQKDPAARYQDAQELLTAMSDGDAAGAESSLTLGASGAHAALESKSAPAGGSTLRFGVAGVAAMALLLGVGATAVAALAYQTYNNGANSQPAAAAIAVPPAVAAVPGPGPEPVTEAVAVEPPPPVEPPPTITEPTPPSVATPTPPRPKVKPIANVVQPEPAVLPPVTQAVVATLPVLPAATAAAKPAPEIVLKAVEVDQAGGVKIVLTMSNATVRPMHYLMEGASEDFPMQYVIEFKGGASEVSQRIAVGNSLVDSVTVSNSKGKLRISVNVKQAAKFGFTGTGPTWNIAVTPS